MKVVLCMDSWKGSLSALEACEWVGKGLVAGLGDPELTFCPMADGGEGTLELVNRSRPGSIQTLEVTGPFVDRRIPAPYLLWPDQRRALVEMAVCAGLPLLGDHERDPMRTTTLGVGELMMDALRQGAEEIVLALGGSATVDGGTGMAASLGWRFLDAQGRELPPGGGALERLVRVVPPAESFPAKLRVMCDVINPLLGPAGAAAVFGPQKGAGPEEVQRLEAGLEKLVECLEHDAGIQGVSDLPGGGAAGGMAAGAVAFFGGRLVSGVEEVMSLAGVEEALHDADWVITGEGRFDAQSLDGKVVSGVMSLAESGQVPVAVVCGSCGMPEEEWRRRGIRAVQAANDRGLPVEQAMLRAAGLAKEAGRRLAGDLRNSPGSARG